MNLGERLQNLRKLKHLSQEEVADKLNVTRQTISKWETDQSTPDFDKIIPLCNLYGISADELLTGVKKDETVVKENEEIDKKKRGRGISISVLLYFLSIIWIMIAIPVIKMNPAVASSIFLAIVGIATYYLIYTCVVYKKKKTKKEIKQHKLLKMIFIILALIILIIYLIVSFITFAWHITWLLWILFILIYEIIKLIISLKGDEDEE